MILGLGGGGCLDPFLTGGGGVLTTLLGDGLSSTGGNYSSSSG